MVQSAAATVDDYLADLPSDRRDTIARVREVVNANLPTGFLEGMQSGMIAWYVPLERYPDTYNGQPIGIAGLASQKRYMALYLLNVYSAETEAWFRGRSPQRARSSTWASRACGSRRSMRSRST